MANKKIKYVCTECGNITPKWLGKCPVCESWGTVQEELEIKLPISSKKKDIELTDLTEIKFEKEFRIKTEFSEFDRVLGGGLTQGEVVLITGNPGIGKSTFLLQLSNEYSKSNKVLYISGEESNKQIKERALRIGVNSKSIYLLSETNLENIQSAIDKSKPKVVIIDSIQTIYSELVSSVPGSVSQIRECALKLIEIAKQKDISFYIVGHVTKDGKLAGPKLLEHMVDAVLSFEGDENNYYRIIRSIKNRYGSTNEISIFDMKEDGVEEIKNPSEFFISERDEKNVGSIITTSIEGSRVILFEIQTLSLPLKYGIPKRIIEGYDRNRIEILLAVLSKTLSLDLGNNDIYLNIPGGIVLKDQAADLAIILSLISTIKNLEISQKIAAIGEIGLRGEVRKVSFIKKRIRELEKLGFKGVYLPKSHQSDFENFDTKLKLSYINNISELVERL
ncbi:DNA repair protein RadA [Streptobacillus felis]|uniref:DNA repair protein RadA n=1 Tax=Streptobacillus felis TaxID=1384509 RepID=A0A7Z0PFZ7_9FUSO|nr:DNA repair protein RadA [Streptobacillus felis]NYV27385.1 DNA repair protein RadA [Streptobacillus felis]